mgnify:CR=1 FL=1
MSQKSKFEYDVAFSFAGAQRAYVEQVRNALRKYDISVFYDNDNSVDLWGKNLYRYLDELYSKKARYCVMFISKEYGERSWTIHESQSAQERIFSDYDNVDFQEYILPVFFDNTQIPGIRCTTGYMDARKVSPEELAEKIAKKLGKTLTVNPDSSVIPGLFKELLSQIDKFVSNNSFYHYINENDYAQVTGKDTNSTILSIRRLEDCITLDFFKTNSGYNPSLLIFFDLENMRNPIKVINFSNYFFQTPEENFTLKEWKQLFNDNILKILESENDIISR